MHEIACYREDQDCGILSCDFIRASDADVRRPYIPASHREGTIDFGASGRWDLKTMSVGRLNYSLILPPLSTATPFRASPKQPLPHYQYLLLSDQSNPVSRA